MKGHNKYNNKKVIIDGIEFDSTKEGNRYVHLKSILNNGEIKELRLQPSFRISEGGIRDPKTGRMMAARKFTADFSYVIVATGKHIVEDVKSSITAKETAYRIRRQLFLEKYGKDCVFLET